MSRLDIPNFFQTEFMKTNDSLEKAGDYYLMNKKFSDQLLQEAMNAAGVEGYSITPQTRILFREEYDPNNPTRKMNLRMFVGIQLMDKLLYHETLNKNLQNYLQSLIDIGHCMVESVNSPPLVWKNIPVDRSCAENLSEFIMPHPERNAPDPIHTGTATAKQFSEHLSKALSAMNEAQFQNFLKENGTVLGSGEYGGVYKISRFNAVQMHHPIAIKVFHELDTTAHYCAAYAREWNFYYQDVLGLRGYACANFAQLSDQGRSFVLTPFLEKIEFSREEQLDKNLSLHSKWKHRGGDKMLVDWGVYGNIIKFAVEGTIYCGVVDFDRVVEFWDTSTLSIVPSRRPINVLPPQTKPDSYPVGKAMVPYPQTYNLFTKHSVRIVSEQPETLRTTVTKPADSTAVSSSAGIAENIHNSQIARVSAISIKQNDTWWCFSSNYPDLCNTQDITAYYARLLSLPNNERYKAENFLGSYPDRAIPKLTKEKMHQNALAIITTAKQPGSSGDPHFFAVYTTKKNKEEKIADKPVSFHENSKKLT